MLLNPLPSRLRGDSGVTGHPLRGTGVFIARAGEKRKADFGGRYSGGYAALSGRGSVHLFCDAACGCTRLIQHTGCTDHAYGLQLFWIYYQYALLDGGWV